MPDVTYEWIPVGKLRTNEKVNRPLSELYVQNIIKNFDPDAIKPIIVGVYEGSYIIIDGGHSTEAVRRMFGDSELLYCKVFHNKTLPQMAALFVLLNTQHLPSALQRYLKGVFGADPTITAINKIVEAYGWKVSPEPKNGHIQASSALMRAEAKYGLQALEDSFASLTGTWNHDRAISGTMIQGFALFFYRNRWVSVEEVIKKLQGFPRGATGFLAEARGMQGFVTGQLSVLVAQQMVNLYNKGKRTSRLRNIRG